MRNVPGREREPPTCSQCGSTRFYVTGLVEYKEAVDTTRPLDNVGTPRMEWARAYPSRVACALCELDAGQLFLDRNMLGKIYERAPVARMSQQPASTK